MPSSLAARLLFHSSPPPPLLVASNVDLSNEIYDLIALSLRAYVSPWYSKLSRYDKDFLPQLSSVLAQVILNLQQRLSSCTDIPSLMLIDVPLIIAQHYRDFRLASLKVHPSGAPSSTRSLFSRVQPHIAFDDDGLINVEYYRQVVLLILKQLLPQDDFAPDAERFITAELILNIFLNDIMPRISQPAFIYSLLIDILGSDQELDTQTSHDPTSTSIFSFHNLIVAVLSALQTFSTLCLSLIHHYKYTILTAKHLQQQNPSPYPTKDYARPSIILISEILSAQTSFFLTLIFTSLSMITSFLSIPIFSNSPPMVPLLLPHLLVTTLSSPAFLLSSMRSIKNSLFPNGYPGPPPSDPTPEQISLLKMKVVNSICRNKGKKFPGFLLGPNRQRTVEEALEPLSDEVCNKRLLVNLLDRVLVDLFPELEQGH